MEAGETPPTSFSALLRPRLSARPQPAAGGMGSSGEWSWGRTSCCEQKRGGGVFFKEKENQKKVRLQPGERAPPG